RDVVLEIDWQGARQVRAACPECHSIFILPPSRDALRERLQARRTDSEEVIARRLRDAVGDMSHYGEFDSVIVNNVFEQAVADLQHIVKGGSADFAPGRPALQPVLRDLLA
ncbi:MAG: guanylate kinase, partial [Steroidobacteraceae bacterium]